MTAVLVPKCKVNDKVGERGVNLKFFNSETKDSNREKKVTGGGVIKFSPLKLNGPSIFVSLFSFSESFFKVQFFLTFSFLVAFRNAP